MDEVQELQMLRRLKELEAKASGGSGGESMMDTLAGYVPDAVKNIGTAAYKGVASLGAAAADAFAGSHDTADAVMALTGNPVRKVDTSMPVSRALESTGYKPKTQAERYINSGVRGATAALLSPAGVAGPVRAAVTGLGAGLGGEAAGQLPGVKGSKYEPYAQVVGALVGGAATGLAGGSVRNTKQLAGEMFEGTTPQQIEEAKRKMVAGRIASLPLNLDQALGQDTNVTNVVRSLVGRKEGQALVNQLRAQPAQAKTLADRLVGQLPGEVQTPTEIANATQGAATEALKAARSKRSNAVRPLYQAAGDLEPDVVEGMKKRVLAAAEAAPDTNKGALYQDIAQVLEAAQKRAAPVATGLLDSAGKPIMSAAQPISAEQLNDSLRSFTNGLKNTTLSAKAGDREAVGAAHGMIKELRDRMGAVSAPFKDANDLYAHLSRTEVDPLKKSVIGRVAGMSGELADKEAVNKMLPILARGSDPKAARSEILTFAEKTKGNPMVFQDAVKTNFSNAVAKAEQQVSGELSPNFPKALESSLLGDAMKRNGFKEQLTAVAVHQGLAPDSLYKPFMKAMQILSAAGKRPGSLGPDGAALHGIASKSTAASALKMIGLAPGKPAGQGVQRLLSGDAYRTLADNLTTPEGVAKLQALAKVPLMSVAAQNIVSTMLATQATTKPGEVQNSNSGGLFQGENQ